MLYRLLTQELVDQMRGTIVAIPALSPAGLRTKERKPYHADEDPNRLWPDGKPEKPPDPDKEPPTSLELAYKRLFDEIVATADYLIDYHNAWTGSISFAFRDRVLYRADQDAERHKAEAEALAARQDEMLRAFGHTIVREFPAEKYVDEKLHRSTSAAALFLAGIPAFTVELGAGLHARSGHRRCRGCRHAQRDALGRHARRRDGADRGHPGGRPRLSRCGAADAAREPRPASCCTWSSRATSSSAGDPVAEVRDVWGRPLGEGLLRAEYDGFVIGRSHGIYFYPGDAVLGMAIRDEAPLVAPYPEDFFSVK